MPISDNPILGPYFYPEMKLLYTGQYRNGKREGMGEQIWNDGSCYQGFFENDQSSGKGVQVYITGDWYKGDWKDGMSHGLGEYHHLRDKITYKGEWYRGEQHGFGKETYQDGSIYEGKNLILRKKKLRFKSKLFLCFSATWSFVSLFSLFIASIFLI